MGFKFPFPRPAPRKLRQFVNAWKRDALKLVLAKLPFLRRERLLRAQLYPVVLEVEPGVAAFAAGNCHQSRIYHLAQHIQRLVILDRIQQYAVFLNERLRHLLGVDFHRL